MIEHIKALLSGRAGALTGPQAGNEIKELHEAVAAILSRAVEAKPTGHRLDEGISTRSRSMFQIGG